MTDDPTITAIIQAIEPTWRVIAAHDGLLGLDVFSCEAVAG